MTLHVQTQIKLATMLVKDGNKSVNKKVNPGNDKIRRQLVVTELIRSQKKIWEMAMDDIVVCCASCTSCTMCGAFIDDVRNVSYSNTTKRLNCTVQ